MTAHLDFWNDWLQAARTKIASLGCHLPDTPTDDDAIRFFNVVHRYIEPRRRQVHTSNELDCPVEHAGPFNEICRRAESGEDLNAYLSKDLLRPNYADHLHSDWGLHHLHLGAAFEPSGFVERSGPLLFCRVTASEVFMIQVKAHGAWADRDLLEVVSRNWPELLAPYELVGVLAVHQDPTAHELLALRKANVNTFITLPGGKVYVGMGGGYTTSGTSLKVMEKVRAMRKDMRRLEGLARDLLRDYPSAEWHLKLDRESVFADNGRGDSVELERIRRS